MNYTAMIKLEVKSIWQGKVAIRQKYLEQAYKNKKGLEIHHAGSIMLIPFDKIKDSVVAKSEKSVYDKFKGEYHWLIYFNWKPTILQKQLL